MSILSKVRFVSVVVFLASYPVAMSAGSNAVSCVASLLTILSVGIALSASAPWVVSEGVKPELFESTDYHSWPGYPEVK